MSWLNPGEQAEREDRKTGTNGNLRKTYLVSVFESRGIKQYLNTKAFLLQASFCILKYSFIRSGVGLQVQDISALCAPLFTSFLSYPGSHLSHDALAVCQGAH